MDEQIAIGNGGTCDQTATGEQTTAPADGGSGQVGLETKSEQVPGAAAVDAKETVPGDTKPNPEKAANPPPREMKAIQAEYAELVGAAGELQYQVEQYKQQLKQLNWRLRAVNQEAAARDELDKAEGAKAMSAAQAKRDRRAAKRAEALKAGLTEAQADTLAAAEETPAPEAAVAPAMAP